MPALPERYGVGSSAADDGFPVVPEEPQPERPDGVALTRTVTRARNQRSEPAGGWLPEADPLDESDYEPMPPKRSFQFKVRIRNNGRGKPLDYPFDDLDLALEP